MSSVAPVIPEPALSSDRWTGWCFVALGFLLACTPLRTFDIWWSLKTGQQILERGWVPQTDWFTYTEPNNEWIDLHWGFQVLVTLVYRYFGISGLVLTKATCLGISAGLMWSALGRRIPTWAKALCWILPLVVVSGRVMVRAEMLSFICLAAWCWTLSRVEHFPRVLWLCPLIQIGWTNCHGLFGVGAVVGTMWTADWCVRRVLNGRLGYAPPPTGLTAGTVFGSWLVTMLAPLLNPYGLRGLIMPWVLYKKLSVDYDFYSTRIEELMPFTEGLRRWGWSDPYVFSMLLLLGLTVLSFLPLLARGKWSGLRILLVAAFVHLALKSVRNMSLLAIVSGTVLAWNLRDWRALILASVSVVPEDSAPQRLGGANWLGRLAVLGMCLAMLTGIWPRWTGSYLFLSLREMPNRFPHKAVQFLGTPGFPERAFIAGYGTAGMYTYYFCPPRRIFMDGRLETASRNTFERYESIRFQMRDKNPAWMEDVRDENGQLPVVLLDRATARSSIAGLAQQPGWRPVYSDGLAVVFIEDSLAEKLRLPRVNPAPQ